MIEGANPGDTNQTARPSRFDSKVMRSTARSLLPNIAPAIGVHLHDRNEYEEVLDELYTVLLDAFTVDDLDGYQLASKLGNDLNWDPDAKLVALLDDAQYHNKRCHDQAVIDWVTHNNIKPKFKVGDKVVVTINGQKEQGVVVFIQDQLAKYYVKLGEVHPEYGDRYSILGAYIVDYEEVHAASDLPGPNPSPENTTSAGHAAGIV
jgi:hypothetical protein